ncbi:unnamed protein product [Rangifer tarandus platyrhynchus]|uniref:Uncharacterized protein n=1 Tax=Rangifer tarandus platyrhynchus TaxID=3082113 RepID=A0AC59Y4R6_RANTA
MMVGAGGGQETSWKQHGGRRGGEDRGWWGQHQRRIGLVNRQVSSRSLACRARLRGEPDRAARGSQGGRKGQREESWPRDELVTPSRAPLLPEREDVALGTGLCLGTGNLEYRQQIKGGQTLVKMCKLKAAEGLSRRRNSGGWAFSDA